LVGPAGFEPAINES